MPLILLLIVRSMQDHNITLPRLSHRNDDRFLYDVSGFTLDERPIDTTLFRQAGHEPADEVVSVDCERVGLATVKAECRGRTFFFR